MRQKDDLEFAKLLNRLREGNQTEDDICTLRTKLYTERCDENINKLPHLFTTRAEAEQHNNLILAEVPSHKKLQ